MSMLVIINVCLYKFPFAQGTTTIMVNTFYLTLLNQANPHSDPLMTGFEISLLWDETLFLLFGFLFASPNFDKAQRKSFARALYIVFSTSVIKYAFYVAK